MTMKRKAKPVTCIALIITMLSHYMIMAAAEVEKKVMKVPLGTPITLTLLETLSSKTAQVGQRVRFSVASDVNIEGKTIVKRGATALGEITAAGSSGMAGTAGSLTVSLQTVEATDGTLVPISATKGAKGESRLAQSVAITALCCIFAIFMKGKDVTFEQGSTYSAFTIAPVEVKVGE